MDGEPALAETLIHELIITMGVAVTMGIAAVIIGAVIVYPTVRTCRHIRRAHRRRENKAFVAAANKAHPARLTAQDAWRSVPAAPHTPAGSGAFVGRLPSPSR
jgi:hypothetical protein